MATVPLSGTNIRLLSGVPFQSDYKNTRWFNNQTDQLNYFTSKPIVHSMSDYTFQRIEGRPLIRVNKSIDELWNVNYLMFQNTNYNSKWFYAFVTKVEYINAGLTHVHFQIDVFQTWKFDMNFKPSYVVREHCKLWESDGSPMINTVDEGLNYGSTYETVNVLNWKPYDDVLFLVIVTKALLHDRESGEKAGDIYPNINASPQPLCYYVHPFKLNGTLPTCQDEQDNIVLSTPSELLQGIYTMDNAVNDIVSIYITDYFGFDIDVDSSGTLIFPSSNFVNVNKAYNINGTTKYFNTIFVSDIKSYIGKSAFFTNKYADYRSVKESKLLMYPYTTLILDDLKGNRQTIMNEYIKGDDITLTIHGSLGTSNKTSYGIENYQLKDNLEPADWFYASLENSLFNDNPNDLPIITDMLAAYLQGNRNSIQNQKNSTIFNGILNGLGGVMSTVSGAITGAAAGSLVGPEGTLAGAVVGGVSGAMSTAKGAGNTVLQIQGINAKQKDINNTPASLSKMGSNSYFDYGHNLRGLYLIKRQITPEYQKKLEDFFNMYGYKINEVKTPNFNTRQFWNYVQTASCNIQGNFNNEDLNELKAIFDNGITLWHTDDIGNYSLDNGVI
jgi:hypothetical protein